MKAKSVSVRKLMQGNKRGCLSALRPLGECFKCNHFINCESRIVTDEAKEFLRDRERIKELQGEVKAIKTKYADVPFWNWA